MKKYLLGAAVFAAFAPCAAVAETNGHLDLGFTTSDSDFGADDVESTSVSGQVAFTGGPIGFQLDAGYASVETSSSADVWGVGGHVFTRNESWLFGGYVGYGKLDSGGEAEETTIAAETQFYLPRSTISGVLSYSEDDSIFELSATMIDGEYRHFITDNFSIQAGLGFGQGEIGVTDIDFWRAQVGGEYQFDALPVSIFAGYRQGTLDAGGGGDIETSSVGIGVRYNWGEGTLLERNRNGASLARVPSAIEWIFGSFGV
jgi:hypothetical protein